MTSSSKFLVIENGESIIVDAEILCAPHDVLKYSARCNVRITRTDNVTRWRYRGKVRCCFFIAKNSYKTSKRLDCVARPIVSESGINTTSSNDSESKPMLSKVIWSTISIKEIFYGVPQTNSRGASFRWQFPFLCLLDLIRAIIMYNWISGMHVACEWSYYHR
jgi:hypothetical protein